MEKKKEKEKIKRFYIGFTLIWLVATIAYFVGSQMVGGDDSYQPILNILLVFFVILIPIIMLLSIPLFFAEGIMDRIKERIDQHNADK